jgi:hypothetical protein
MPQFKLPAPGDGEGVDRKIQLLYDAYNKMRKELEWLLQHLDEDNLPTIEQIINNYAPTEKTVELAKTVYVFASNSTEITVTTDPTKICDIYFGSDIEEDIIARFIGVFTTAASADLAVTIELDNVPKFTSEVTFVGKFPMSFDIPMPKVAPNDSHVVSVKAQMSAGTATLPIAKSWTIIEAPMLKEVVYDMNPVIEKELAIIMPLYEFLVEVVDGGRFSASAELTIPPMPQILYTTGVIEGGMFSETHNLAVTEPEALGRAIVIDQKMQTGDDMSLDIYSDTVEGFTFTPSVNHTCNYLMLKLLRVGYPGTVNIDIFATDGNGKPTGSALASMAVDGDYLPTDPTSINCRRVLFFGGIAVTAGTKYAVTLRAAAGNAQHKAMLRVDGSAPAYTRGERIYSTNGGTTWTSDTARDPVFEEGDAQTYPEFYEEYGHRLPGVENSESSGTHIEGQTFTVRQAHDATLLTLKICRGGEPGQATVEIFATDGAGLPTGAALFSLEINGNNLETYMVDRSFVISPTLALSAAKYAATIKAPNPGLWPDIVTGWETPGVFSSASISTDQTLGWKFRVNGAKKVTHLGVYARYAATYKMHLWGADVTPLATAEGACTAGVWNWFELATPVEIVEGVDYIVSHNHRTTGGSYCYRRTATAAEFNADVTPVSGMAVAGKDTKPTTVGSYYYSAGFKMDRQPTRAAKVLWRRGGDEYAGGERVYSDDSGATWAADSTKDNHFREGIA